MARTGLVGQGKARALRCNGGGSANNGRARYGRAGLVGEWPGWVRLEVDRLANRGSFPLRSNRVRFVPAR